MTSLTHACTHARTLPPLQVSLQVLAVISDAIQLSFSLFTDKSALAAATHLTLGKVFVEE